ncbi:MAG: Uma2 family endonuclease [Verrucomicrobiales bacterium]
MALTRLHPDLQKRVMPLSVEAWHQMIGSGLVSERAELIRGVIEIAVTTLAEDRERSGIHAEAGVEEYCVVDAPHQCIEVCRQPLDGHYLIRQIISGDKLATCASLPGVNVNVGDLFRGMK